MDNNTSLVNRLYEDIDKLSLFDLAQLHLSMYNLLNDPEKNLAVKRNLKPGMRIKYYELDGQVMVEAIILEVRNTRAIVQNVVDNRKWNIYLRSINIDGKDNIVYPKRQSGKLDRNSLKIGDRVGYRSKDENDVFGVIKKLNPKKAVVVLSTGQIWNVPYGMLFLVMDGVSMNTDGCLLIEGEIINH